MCVCVRLSHIQSVTSSSRVSGITQYVRAREFRAYTLGLATMHKTFDALSVLTGGPVVGVIDGVTQWRTEGGFKSPPPPKFRTFDKAEPNSQFRGKYIRNNPPEHP
jgi:hypothetical protein